MYYYHTYIYITSAQVYDLCGVRSGSPQLYGVRQFRDWLSTHVFLSVCSSLLLWPKQALTPLDLQFV